jgi:hypothetical protein
VVGWQETFAGRQAIRTNARAPAATLVRSSKTLDGVVINRYGKSWANHGQILLSIPSPCPYRPPTCQFLVPFFYTRCDNRARASHSASGHLHTPSIGKLKRHGRDSTHQYYVHALRCNFISHRRLVDTSRLLIGGEHPARLSFVPSTCTSGYNNYCGVLITSIITIM